jgi:hypothetical protein
VFNTRAAEESPAVDEVVEVEFQFFIDAAIELVDKLLEDEFFDVAVALSDTINDELIDVISMTSLEEELLDIKVVVSRVLLKARVVVVRSLLSVTSWVPPFLSIPAVLPIVLVVVEVLLGGQTSALVMPYLHNPG